MHRALLIILTILCLSGCASHFEPGKLTITTVEHPVALQYGESSGEYTIKKTFGSDGKQVTATNVIQYSAAIKGENIVWSFHDHDKSRGNSFASSVMTDKQGKIISVHATDADGNAVAETETSKLNTAIVADKFPTIFLPFVDKAVATGGIASESIPFVVNPKSLALPITGKPKLKGQTVYEGTDCYVFSYMDTAVKVIENKLTIIVIIDSTVLLDKQAMAPVVGKATVTVLVGDKTPGFGAAGFVVDLKRTKS